MALLNLLFRCPGNGCPSKEICRRYQRPAERLLPNQVRAALFARRADDAAACREYLERESEEGDHAAQ